MSKFVITIPDTYDDVVTHGIFSDVVCGRYEGLCTIGIKKTEDEKIQTKYNTGSDTRPDNEEGKVALSPEEKLIHTIFDKGNEMPCEKCEYGEEMEKLSTTIKVLMEQYLAVPVCLIHDYNNAIRKCSEKDCDTDADSKDS